MWDTVLDHRLGYINGLAEKTYLVCIIHGEPEPIRKENTESKHAEIHLKEYLEKKKVDTNKITVYINNSPCVDCATKLKEYLENKKDIQLTLYVTHLYNIRRMSCQLGKDAGKEDHMRFITSHEATYQGLKNLLSMGEDRCTIEAFTEDVWKELHEVMGLTEDFQQRRTEYDTKNKEKNYDRSRKKEDSNIKKDLIHLKKYSDPWEGIRKE